MQAAWGALAAAVLIAGAAGQAAGAPVVTIHPASEGLDHIDVTIDGSQITVEEFWTGAGLSFLQIEDLDVGVIYSLQLIIHNDTGSDWLALSLELLDPAGNPQDALDPIPQPEFVIEGFSTSNDFDGLSFAQAQAVARSSTVWSVVTADEESDARDFLQFTEGTLQNGGTDEALTFGLRDLRGVGLGGPEEGINSPFLLSHDITAVDVPEPVLAGLLVLGLAALARRRSLG